MGENGTSATGLSGSELAARIRDGSLSALEVVEAHIRRLEEIEPRLNALVVRTFEQALTEANAADAARARGEALGPLHGVPVTIKEQFLVAGTPTTLGLPNRASHRAEADGPLVARLRSAGAIVLGKTNVGQLLMYYESDNPLYGRTINPWDSERTPGGSSGGEAAVIAAGGSAIGLGGDLGGSVRIPAHFCGITGLKPSSWRLTNLDTPSDVFFLQNVIVPQPGPMARRVADLALTMEVLAAPGQEALDPSVEPRAWPDPTAVDVGGLRVGVYEDDGWFTASPAVRRAVRETAAVLESRGARVDEFRPPDVGEALRLFLAVLSADGFRTLRAAIKGQPVMPQIKGLLAAAKIPPPMRPVVAALLTRSKPHAAMALRCGGARDAEGLRSLAEETERYRRRFLAAMSEAGLDALVCPPCALPALRHGTGEDLTVHTAGSYASLFNVLGFPAGVVPCTRVRPGEESDRASSRDVPTSKAIEVERGSAGLPVGVQVAAPPWREDVVLAVMSVLEEDFASRSDLPVDPPI